jgi:hypothetical protein
LRLQLVHIEPEVSLGVELHRLGISEDVARLWETAPDMPQGSREGTAGLALWPVAPEEISQPLSGLRLLAMQSKIGEQRLGLERGWLGQLLTIVPDVQRA